MNKKIKILGLISGLFLVTACSAGESLTNWFNSRNGIASSLQESYDLYETIKIPTHTFSEEEGSATVKGVVILPDGTSFNGEELVISQIGTYEVRYSAKIGDKNYTYSQSFLVKKPLFQYTNSTGSSVSYTIPSYAKKYTNANGVYVSLAKGDTLTINEVIDLSDTTKDDKVISVFVTPSVQREFDFSQFTFTLTDSENPNIKMSVLANAQSQTTNNREYVYFRAGGENQVLTGKYTNPSTGNVTYQTRGNLGTIARISFHACYDGDGSSPTDIDPQSDPLYFCYDSEDIAVHVPVLNGSKFIDASKCADFDNSEYFKNSLWNGFPSKKAYLSISCGRFASNAAKFCITSILGVDIEQKYIEDNNAPVITTEFQGLVMPEGQLGCAYKIPKATAFDVEEQAEKEVITKVFYNYGTSNAISVNTTNNEFKPDRKGTYCIEYTAKDLYGNVGIKTLTVHVGNEVKPIDFTVPSLPSEVLGGESIELLDAINPSGGVGEYQTKVYVSDPIGNDEEISLGTFTPRAVGQTTITYEVIDYNGNSTKKSVLLNVTDNSDPVFSKIENLEDTYITEFENLMPSCYVNVVENKKVVQKVCDIDVVDAKGTNTYKFSDDNETFKVYGEHSQTTATLNFKYSDQLIKSETINLLEPKEDGYLNMSNYFVGDGFEADSYSSGAVAGIRIKNTANTSNWKFFNKVTARNAKLVINKLNGSSSFGFDSLEIKLTDSLDSNYSVTLKIYESYFLISTDYVKYSVDLATSNSLSISFDQSTVYVNNISFTVKYYDNGVAFNNFPSEKVYISATSNGIASNYAVGTINNFLLYKTKDTTIPDYVLTGDYGGAYSIGSDYFVHKMIYADVVKPYSKACLSVTVNGEFVTAKDGTKLHLAPVENDYVISLDQVGTYNFVYYFTGETETFGYAVYSLDNKAPTIDITSEIPSQVNYGTEIKMPTFTVSDDFTPSEAITIIVSVSIPTGYEKIMQYTTVNEETGAIELVTVSDSITAIYYGTYTIKITAVDATGNSSFKMIDVVVK